MTGRFKNKKTIVKHIDKDEYGMPVINGKKVTGAIDYEKFRSIIDEALKLAKQP